MSYVIDGGEEGKARLNILGRAMNPYSLRTLMKAGLQPGSKCLDAGCGGGTMTYAMAEVAGITGHVTGIDYDKDIIALNREEALANNIRNISFRQGDINELNETNQYDIVFARYLLSHLADPATAFNNMVKALKPGGYIVTEDIQFSGHICYPASPAFEQYIQWYTEVVGKTGGDAERGLYLHTYHQKAGLEDIQLEIAQPAGLDGPAKLMSLVTLEKIKHALLDNHITTEVEFETVHRQLADFTRDSHSLISIPRTFQVWGRKPI